MTRNIYEQDLEKNRANHVALTPISFLFRSEAAFPEKVAVIDGARRFTYRQFAERCRRLASALKQRGIGKGDTVSILAPNVAAMLECHYGVPMTGAVLNALNTRLDDAALAYCLRHGEARLMLVEREYLPLAKRALAKAELPIPLIVISESDADAGEGEESYEALLLTGRPDDAFAGIEDEWSAITLGYTSGTTGAPKGAASHHRGAYLNALGNALAAHLDEHSAYLWTLPMFHCNGWSHTWAVTAVGGTHVCLRRVDPEQIFALIHREKVTHLSAAPVVLGMLANAQQNAGAPFPRPVRILTGGSVPPTAVMVAIEKLGFVVMHIYGMTESTGPSLICEWPEEWNALPLKARMSLNARQGVRLATMEEAIVADPETGREVAWDGRQMGEILLRGNTVMMGYLKDREATEKALARGWLHTGDLAVRHPDGYIEIKDRVKDIIISGGENISSVEIEEILYRHPAVLEAAVVSRPDRKWGEHPCAFVALRDGADGTTAEMLKDYCSANMARFKVPKTFVFGPLPKNATGKVLKTLLRERARAIPAAEDKAEAL
jgi:fatty-acyl-CoA synthase